MCTTDRVSLALHHRLEFTEDIDLVVLELRKPARHIPEVIRFGRTFASAAPHPFLIRHPIRIGAN